FWETRAEAPEFLFLIPDVKNERNLMEFGRLPGVLSLLAFASTKATVKGLKDFPPEDRPPVTLTFVAFRVMVGLGFLFALLTLVGWFKRNKLESSPCFLKVMLYAIPLPYVALEAGWIVTEVGRQPWIVYGLMRTGAAVSPIAASQVAVSLAAFLVVYGLLGGVAFYLIAKHARRGPEPAPAAAAGGEG
ncbi:MAG: cytochrome ubiquinol oxidase subunit I, partial [Desulfobaccales bacterium]